MTDTLLHTSDHMSADTLTATDHVHGKEGTPLIRLLFIVCTIGLLTFGCQPANKPPANQAAPPPNIPETIHVKQTAPEAGRPANPQAIARRLTQIAISQPQVRGATAVVAGRYTVVGIDIDPALDRGRVGTIKYSVAQALRKDPYGAHALVTADVDLVQRLRELSEDVRQGRPAVGVAQELAEIVNRLMPQPSKTVPKREQQNTKLNQEKIDQSPSAPSPRQ
ncbi:YhcN/YlaJ family sporulation lipoprotein [Polycladomyces abyssicola]|uniref:YhcN/YlaJ family sporulation lipoprotein n=1 Tax=Polycladomyces abyssicola TaxID=1125966 RepID=UPI001FE7946E|nr:YhcN/YlaJ family sporulation lipoprotein [Polycladomyces abyssicola]